MLSCLRKCICLGVLCLVGCARTPIVIPIVEEPIEEIEIEEVTSIAMLPICDMTDGELPWDIESDFRDLWCARQKKLDHLEFISTDDLIITSTDTPSVRRDATKNLVGRFFGQNLEFANLYTKSDYIVAMQLVHSDVEPIIPDELPWQFPAEAVRVMSLLQMNVQIRLIDLRGDCPILLAAETFTTNVLLPEGGSRVDYERAKWGSKNFRDTPWAIGQHRMLNDLCSHIETLLQRL